MNEGSRAMRTIDAIFITILDIGEEAPHQFLDLYCKNGCLAHGKTKFPRAITNKERKWDKRLSAGKSN